MGRRVARTEGANTTIYAQSGQQTLCDYAAGAAPSASTYRYLFASYIDEPVVRITTSGSVATYLHRNQQYSITALTNSTGAVIERYAYTAYGVPTNASGTVLTSSAQNNRYLYTGREWDGAISLYHYRARMYDASLDRFCSRDPIGYLGSKFCLYEYCGSSPLDGGDPNGLRKTVGTSPEGYPIYQYEPGDPGPAPPYGNQCFSFSQYGPVWAPCPPDVPDRPIDPAKPITTYNCAGLAFRDYTYKSKADTERKLAGCKAGTLGQACPKGSGLKCVYYDITGIDIFNNGKKSGTQKADDFHIECQAGSGDNCCSKNGQSPIEGPKPIGSFPPDQPFPPPQLPPGITIKAVFTTTVYCCPG